MPTVLAFFASMGIFPTQDMGVFAGLALVAIVHGLTIGRDRSIVPLLSLYIAYVLTLHLPLVSRLNQWLSLPPGPMLPVLWFLVFFVLGVFLFRRTPHIQPLSRETGSWWEAILFSLLQVGLGVCFVSFLLPSTFIAQWSPHMREVFIGEWGRTFWMTAPLLFLVFLRRGYGYPSDLFLN